MLIAAISGASPLFGAKASIVRRGSQMVAETAGLKHDGIDDEILKCRLQTTTPLYWMLSGNR